jgi:hypothetical protein
VVAHQRVIQRVLRLCLGVVLLGVMVFSGSLGSTASAHGQVPAYPSCNSGNEYNAIIGSSSSTARASDGRIWEVDAYVYGYYRVDTRQFCGLVSGLGIVSATPGSGVNGPW